MKRFKTLLLPLVALSAMGFTLAGRYLAHKEKTPFNVPYCYTPTVWILTNFCTVSNLTCNVGSLGAPVNALSGFSTSVACDDVGNVFCCAQLDVAAQSCMNQLQATAGSPIIKGDGTVATSGYVYVAAIYCKL